MKIEKIDHICFAVKNLDQAVKVYEETLGLKPALTYTAESEKIKVARYYVGDVGVELMESTSPDGEVAKHIRKRGEGFFLISYKVDNVAKSLDELREKGKKLIDHSPRNFGDNHYAFLEPPQKMFGILTELYDGEFDPDA